MITAMRIWSSDESYRQENFARKEALVKLKTRVKSGATNFVPGK